MASSRTVLFRVCTAVVACAGALVVYALLRNENRPAHEPEQAASTNEATAGVREIDLTAVNVESMRSLGKLAAEGSTPAIDNIILIADGLYDGIDYANERPRVLKNYELMTAAFEPIGDKAKSDAGVVHVLLSLLKENRLRGFATNALGDAAAAGQDEAIQALTHPSEFGILESSACGALAKACAANIPEAIDFELAILADEKSRPLWNMAGNALRPLSANHPEIQDAITRATVALDVATSTSQPGM